MQLIYWLNFSKRKNSTLTPSSEGTTINVELKRETSVLNPSFLISGDIGNYIGLNYVKWFNRYYFVSEPISVRNDLFTITCTVDVMATYKTMIGSYNCFVERCSNPIGYDVLVPDYALSGQYDIVNTLTTQSDLYPSFSTQGTFLLRTAGKTSSASSLGVTTYAVSKENIQQVLDFLFTSDNFDFLGDASVKSFFNPFQYIIDCRWFPFVSTVFGSTTEKIPFGWWNSGVDGGVVTAPSVQFAISMEIPDSSYDDFRQYDDRYTSLKIFLPGAGLFLLNPLETGSGRISAQYQVDIATGETLIKVYNNTGYLLGTFSGMMCSQIMLGQMSVQLMDSAKGFFGGIGEIARGNIGSGVSSIIEGAQTILQPTQSVNGTAGNMSSLIYNQRVIFYRMEYGTKEYPTTVYGRPCCRNLTLSTIPGYILCANASISIPGYSSEKDAVNGYLNGGFYYE